MVNKTEQEEKFEHIKNIEGNLEIYNKLSKLIINLSPGDTQPKINTFNSEKNITKKNSDKDRSLIRKDYVYKNQDSSTTPKKKDFERKGNPISIAKKNNLEESISKNNFNEGKSNRSYMSNNKDLSNRSFSEEKEQITNKKKVRKIPKKKSMFNPTVTTKLNLGQLKYNEYRTDNNYLYDKSNMDGTLESE